MEWLKEWLKPVVVIAAMGIFATCTNQRFDSIDRRFDSIDQRFNSIDQRFGSIDQRFDSIDHRFIGIEKQLQAIDQKTFEMNTRLSRVEENLDITDTVPINQSPPSTTP